MSTELEDLLQPSLTAEDDVVGFDRPWHPQWLVLIAAIFGVLPGGWLFAENFRRLGQPRRWLPTIIGTVALGVGLVAAGVWLDQFGWAGLYEAGNRDHQRTFRFVQQIVAIVFGLALAGMQNPRWHIHEGHGGESAPLLKRATVVILLCLPLHYLLVAQFYVQFVNLRLPE